MKNYKELLAENLDWAKETFSQIDAKMSVVTKRSQNKIASGILPDGSHMDVDPLNWTSGFWAGLNFMLYEYTKNPDYFNTGCNVEKKLDAGLANFEGLYHDVGFMWHIVSGAHYRLTGDEDSKRRNLFAASSLFSRFIIDGGFIRAWNGAGRENARNYNWTIVDCMMNIPLLYWASDVLGDDRFERVAMAHADMTLLDHIRPDGSVAHIVEHDRESGEVLKTYGGQGIKEGSSWSRGQSWAVYGFTLSYLHTGEERYLDAAKRVSNYFIANCCDDWLPRVDFRAPSEPIYYDSTAGAIAACGMLELARVLPEDEGGMYAHAAIKILKAMKERFCNFSPDNDYILGYGSARYPLPGMTLEQSGIHIPIIYGDFYFTEAILKLLGSEFNPWMK